MGSEDGVEDVIGPAWKLDKWQDELVSWRKYFESSLLLVIFISGDGPLKSLVTISISVYWSNVGTSIQNKNIKTALLWKVASITNSKNNFVQIPNLCSFQTWLPFPNANSQIQVKVNTSLCCRDYFWHSKYHKYISKRLFSFNLFYPFCCEV